MRRGAGLALVLFLTGCGSHASKQGSTTRVATSVPQPSPVRVTILAPTHRPRVNAPWPVKVRVKDAAGKPVPATLTMRILFGGTPVGKVDNGRVYHFTGTWQEKKGQEITWPAASRGQSLQFEAVVTTGHTTLKRTYAITVR